jgi:hypothetical protein
MIEGWYHVVGVILSQFPFVFSSARSRIHDTGYTTLFWVIHFGSLSCLSLILRGTYQTIIQNVKTVIIELKLTAIEWLYFYRLIRLGTSLLLTFIAPCLECSFSGTW